MVRQGILTALLSNSLSVQMPVMDGIEATKQIRRIKLLEELPVVGWTADFRPAELEKYLEIGMNLCIAKPIRFENLRTSINSVSPGCSF